MICSQKTMNVILVLIVSYAVLLGAGRYSIYAVTVFFCLTILSIFFHSGKMVLKKDILVFLIFAVFAVFSTCYANYKWGALLFSSSILCGSLFYFALRSSESWKEKLLYTLLICGIFNGILGIYQSVDQTNISGFFYDKNAYSGFLTPLIPVSIYLQLNIKKRYLAYATAFLIFSNLLSHSRAGIYTTILAIFMIVIYLWKNKEKDQIRNLAITLFLGFISYFIFSYTVEFFLPSNNVFIKATDSFMGRFYIYHTSLKAFMSAPVFGHGIYSFQGVSGTLINLYNINIFSTYTHAHNIFLNILVELGIVGLFIFLAFFFIVIKGPFYSNGFYFKIAILSFFLHNMYEYNFTAPPFQVLLAILSALIMKEKNEESDIIQFKGWVKKICLYLLLCFFVFVYMPQVIGYLYSDRAKKVETNYKDLLYSAYFGYLLSGAQENLATYYEKVYFSSNKENRQSSDTAEKYYLQALELDSLKGDLYIKIAKFYYRTGRESIAEEYLIKVINLFPYQPIYKYEIAKYYRSMGRHDKAIKVLLVADEFLKKYAALSPFRIKVLNELSDNYKEAGNIKLYDEYNVKADRLTKYLNIQK